MIEYAAMVRANLKKSGVDADNDVVEGHVVLQAQRVAKGMSSNAKPERAEE